MGPVIEVAQDSASQGDRVRGTGEPVHGPGVQSGDLANIAHVV
jgi:hypothetical protein